MINHEGRTYYTLIEIAPTSLYSADYLRVRVAHNKLQALKFNGVWHTTPAWLREYSEQSGQPSRRSLQADKIGNGGDQSRL